MEFNPAVDEQELDCRGSRVPEEEGDAWREVGPCTMQSVVARPTEVKERVVQKDDAKDSGRWRERAGRVARREDKIVTATRFCVQSAEMDAVEVQLRRCRRR